MAPPARRRPSQAARPRPAPRRRTSSHSRPVDGHDYGDRSGGAVGHLQGTGGQYQDRQGAAPGELKGVSVGDTVEITYTEALAIKVETAKK